MAGMAETENNNVREQRCETCRYFDHKACHRYPPAPTFPPWPPSYSR